MKNINTMLMSLFLLCGLLIGCGQQQLSEDGQTVVYSFHGENERFSLSNGVIVLSPDREIFYGGNLEEKDTEMPPITAYDVTFYSIQNGERRTWSSGSVVDYTGNTIALTKAMPRRSGSRMANGDKQGLEDGLYFELRATDQEGHKEVYDMPLELTEVTQAASESEE